MEVALRYKLLSAYTVTVFTLFLLLTLFKLLSLLTLLLKLTLPYCF